MQHHPTSEPVDPSQLREDVRRLLFQDCKDTTTWDHLGNTDPVRRREEKHVTIADATHNEYHDDRLDYVVLPASLSLLYEVAQEKLQEAGKSTCDLHTLLEYAARPMEVMDAHDRLYQHAVDKKARLIAEANERERLAREEEDGHCTFRPAISVTAGRVASKAKSEGGYYGECLVWREATKKKLLKKVEKEQREKWEEDMAEWKMTERSVKLLAMKKKREEDERKRQASSPTRQTLRVITPRSTRQAAPRDDAHLTFTPLTNSTVRKELLLQLGTGFNAAATDGDDGSGNISFGNPADFSVPDATTVIENLQERIEQDIKERNERKAARAREFQKQKTMAQYDRITGQPLFRPNAMPIIKDKAGNTRLFSELTKKEQEACLKNFRSHDVDFVPAIARKAAVAEKHRDIDDIVKNMLEQHSTANKKLAKKRRKVQAEEVEECRFQPKIDKKSHDMVSQSDRGNAGYLAATKAQQHREGKFTDGSNPEVQSTISRDVNGNKKAKISDEALKTLLDRQERFGQEQKRHRAKSELSAERERMAECSFKPKVNAASQKLIDDAERRMSSQSAPTHPIAGFNHPSHLQRHSSFNNNQQRYADPYGGQPGTERSKSAMVKPTHSTAGTTPLGSPHATSGALRRRQSGGFNASYTSVRSENQMDYVSPSWQGATASAPAAENFATSPIAHQPSLTQQQQQQHGGTGHPEEDLGLDDLEGLLADWSSFSRSLSQPTQPQLTQLTR